MEPGICALNTHIVTYLAYTSNNIFCKLFLIFTFPRYMRLLYNQKIMKSSILKFQFSLLRKFVKGKKIF